MFPTSYLVGRSRFILIGLAIALTTASRSSSQVVYVPSCKPLVRVLEGSYNSPDPIERAEVIAWLRERRTPAAFQVLYRAKNDPSPDVRAQSLMGLAEIAPECALDAFQLRHLLADERAVLITLASEEGLIDTHTLRAMAIDSSADASVRASALLELMKLGQPVEAEAWLPLLGSGDDTAQMLAALSIVTESPRTRPVALAQDLAMGQLRRGVRDASEGKISCIVETLRAARSAPTTPLSDWSAALLKACADRDTPERRLVWREALRTLLVIDPSRPAMRSAWSLAFNETKSDPGELAPLAFWALTGACVEREEPFPTWIVEDLAQAGAEHEGFIAACAEAIVALSEGRACGPELLTRLASTGGDAVKRHGVTLVSRLPRHERSRALALLMQSRGAADEPWFARHIARELNELDPITAQVRLIEAHASGQHEIATALVLAGVWSDQLRTDSTLRLVRSLWLAEREIEGARSEARADLADELLLIVDETRGFSAPIRAEAAWLALVLRDQTSEALAHLPKTRDGSPDESSPRAAEADSLVQWAQMQYP